MPRFTVLLLCFLISATLSLYSDIPTPEFPESLLKSGHDILVTENADETTEWKYELLRNAKCSIELSAGLSGGKVLQNMLAIIKDKLTTNPVIRVHVLVSDSIMLKDADRSELLSLSEAFPERFQALINANTGLIMQEGRVHTTENHIKLLIVDEKYFILGGTNSFENLCRGAPPADNIAEDFLDGFLSPAVRDMDIVVSGSKMSHKLRHEFYALFHHYQTGASMRNDAGPYMPSQTDYFPIRAEARTSIPLFDSHPCVVKNASLYAVISGPRHQLHMAGNLYASLIDKAQFSIELGQLYFFPVLSIQTALQNASQRGVMISLITNGLNKRLQLSTALIPLYGYLNRSNYLPLIMGRHYAFWEYLQAKLDTPNSATVHEYDVQHALYHKKVMTVDQRYALIGSYNLGAKSENADFEVIAMIDSPEVALHIERVLIQDKTSSKRVAVSEATTWYFDPFYRLTRWAQSTFLDGIVLDKEHRPQDVMENFELSR